VGERYVPFVEVCRGKPDEVIGLKTLRLYCFVPAYCSSLPL
jgi:hypothetical protein